jgi:hypothetical protein
MLRSRRPTWIVRHCCVIWQGPSYRRLGYAQHLGGGALAGRDIELNRFLDSHRKAGLPLCASEAQLAKYSDMLRLEQCEQQRAKS